MKKFTLLIILSIVTLNTFAQKIITCTNDSIKLQTKNYRFGNIEWEKSSDSINWEKIENQYDTTYVFKPEKTYYYRAVNKLPNCSPIYSSQTLTLRPPVANAGSDRIINDKFLFLSGNSEAKSTGSWSILEGTNGVFVDNTNPETKFTGESGEYKLLWKLENACGSSLDTVSIQIPENTYYDKIVIVDETDKILSTDEEIKNGDYKIEFSDPVPEISNESILIGISGEGFLRKVNTVSNSENNFTISTSQGTLDDILLDGGLELSKIFNLDANTNSNKTDGYKILNKLPTRKDILSNKKFKTGVHYYIIDKKVKSLNDNVKLKKNKEEGKEVLTFVINGEKDLVNQDGIKINLKGNVEFKPEIKSFWNKKYRKKAELFLKMENSTLKNQFIFTLSGDAQKEILNQKFNLFSYSETILIILGNIPISITANIDFEGKANAKMKGSFIFKHKFTNTITTNAGIGYFNKKWENYYLQPKIVNSFENSLEIKGGFLQSLEIGPKITFRLYGLIGPFIEFKLTEDFSLCARSQNLENFNWKGDLELGAKISAGIDSKAWKKYLSHTKNWPTKKLYNLTFPHKLDYFLGNNQQYIKGNPLSNMPEIRVTDNKGNPVQFVTVKFEIEENSTDVVSEEYVVTDIDGYARTEWIPNTDNSSRLKVTVVDCEDNNISNSPFIFTATEVQTSDCTETTLSASYKIENNILTPVAHRGISPYTYSTDNITFSSEEPTITITEGNTYTIYVKDTNGCVASKSYISKPFSCADSNLDLEISTYGNNLDVTGFGGKTPYEYSTFELPGTGFKNATNTNSFGTINTFYDLPNGEHIVIIRDANGCEKNTTINIENNDNEFHAYFEYENDNGLVTFKNFSTGAESYEWDFGDGETSKIINPVKFYNEKKSYNVVLTTLNNKGQKKVYSQKIEIQNSNNNNIYKGNLILSSQNDIDEFTANTYTTIEGDLIIGPNPRSGGFIGGTDIVDISKLSSIKTVFGYVQIWYNEELKNLDGLSNLSYIGESLIIQNNYALLNLNKFGSLSTVGNGLLIEFNLELSNINGFNNLTYINGGLSVSSNSKLNAINGFSNLEMLNGNLSMFRNQKLNNISGFSDLKLIRGDLDINNNLSLTNYCGINLLINEDGITGSYRCISNGYNPTLNQIGSLEDCNPITDNVRYVGSITINSQEDLSKFVKYNYNEITGNLSIKSSSSISNIDNLLSLTKIGGDLSVESNTSLISIRGLSNLKSIGGNLYINSNENLHNIIGLEAITLLNGNLRIGGNKSILNLDGLNNLTTISGELLISGNDNLQDINGFEKLTSILGSIKISRNDNLVNLDGLVKLTSIEELIIERNSKLINLDGLTNVSSIKDSIRIVRNTLLSNLCGLSNLISSVNPSKYIVILNLFNPSKQDIENGICDK